MKLTEETVVSGISLSIWTVNPEHFWRQWNWRLALLRGGWWEVEGHILGLFWKSHSKLSRMLPLPVARSQPGREPRLPAFSVLCAMDRVKTSAPFPHRQVCLPRSWLRKHHYCRSRKQLVTQWADGWAPKVQLTAPHPMLSSPPQVPRCGVEAIPAYRLLWCLFQPPFSMLSLFLSLPFGPVLFLPFLCPYTPERSCNRTLSFPTRASPGTQIPAWWSL